MRQSSDLVVLLFAPLVALSGCGGPAAVPVNGKVLKDGSVYAPPEGQIVYVTFYGSPTKGNSGKSIQGGQPYQAKVDQTNGTFAVRGPDGRGIPPGKYRIAVTQKMTREAFDAANPKPVRGVQRDDDLLKGRFGPETSPITREIQPPGEEVAIDLEKEKPKEVPRPPTPRGDDF